MLYWLSNNVGAPKFERGEKLILFLLAQQNELGKIYSISLGYDDMIIVYSIQQIHTFPYFIYGPITM